MFFVSCGVETKNCFLTEKATPGMLLKNLRPTPSTSPRVASCLNFHEADSKRTSHDEEETRQTHCSCSFCVLRGPSCFSAQRRNSKPDIHRFFFSFWPPDNSINNIKTKSQLTYRNIKKNAKEKEDKL